MAESAPAKKARAAKILARLTKKARILLIGNPLPVIKHPLRMAEELAEIDLISRGRLI